MSFSFFVYELLISVVLFMLIIERVNIHSNFVR